MKRLVVLFCVSGLLVLSLALPAATAPKDTRTVCVNGQEQQINANRSLPKGATEGPCVDLEALCLSINPNLVTFIPPDQCQYSLGNAPWRSADGTVALTGNPTYLATYDPTTGWWGEGTLVDYTIEACSDMTTGMTLPNDDPRCTSAPPPATNQIPQPTL